MPQAVQSQVTQKRRRCRLARVHVPPADSLGSIGWSLTWHGCRLTRQQLSIPWPPAPIGARGKRFKPKQGTAAFTVSRNRHLRATGTFRSAAAPHVKRAWSPARRKSTAVIARMHMLAALGMHIARIRLRLTLALTYARSGSVQACPSTTALDLAPFCRFLSCEPLGTIGASF